MSEREKDPPEPEDENQACEDKPDRRPAHRHERDHDKGQRNRRGCVDPASRGRPRESVASQKIADCGGEDFRPGCDAIERRRERVRRARRGHADDHDFAA